MSSPHSATDWTTVAPRTRAPGRSTPPPTASGTTHHPGHGRPLMTTSNKPDPTSSHTPRGRSSSRGEHDLGHGYDHTLSTIREDGYRPRARSAAPPIHQPPPLGSSQPMPLITLHRPSPIAPTTGFGGTTDASLQHSTLASTVTPTRPSLPAGGFFPPVPSYDNHAEQQEPTPEALDIMHSALSKHLRHWSLSDFGPLAELTGRSVLVSLLVDYSHAVRPGGLSSMQRRSLAQRARTTHPGKLLQLIKDRKRALEYTELTLTTAYPPQIESQLCPAETPDLVANDGLRKRIRNPNLTRGDLLQLILPFMQCYYSSDTGIESIIRAMPLPEIRDLVYTPGAIMQLMKSPQRLHHFETPHWYSLRRTPTCPFGPSDAHTPSNPHLPTLQLLGLPHTFPALPTSTQKTLLLSALPTYLADKVAHSRVLEIIIEFGNFTPDELLQALLPPRFNNLLTSHTDSRQVHRYRIVFKHDNVGTSHWRDPCGLILAHWLRAVLPPLGLAHSVALTSSPHDLTQLETIVSMTFLPPHAELQKYIYDIRPRHNKAKRFEVWLTSTCPSLGTDMSADISPQALADYRLQLQTHHIRIQRAEYYLADSIPCVLLTQSISQDIDALIVNELYSRILKADLANASPDPPFYTTWCSIATTDARHSTMAKCVMTHPMVAPALTEVLLALPSEDASQVTGGYGFLPIPTPSTMGDEARYHAITVQLEFSQRLISTQISGLPPTDWFTTPGHPAPPQLTPPAHLRHPTWADLIVRGSFTQDDHTLTPSPIIKLSTDVSCTRCSFTAYKADAEALVRYTRLLFIALSSWAGDAYPLTCHVSSAQVLLSQANYASHALPGTGHDTLLRTTADTLHAEIRELRDLILAQSHEIGNLASRLDAPNGATQQPGLVLEDMASSVTSSITSTLSSASRTASTHCQQFLASQKTMLAAFFHDHTTQLTSLYARSNASETRDTQFHNLVRTYTESIKSRDAEISRSDLLRHAVEHNTQQLSHLVTAFQSTTLRATDVQETTSPMITGTSPPTRATLLPPTPGAPPKALVSTAPLHLNLEIDSTATDSSSLPLQLFTPTPPEIPPETSTHDTPAPSPALPEVCTACTNSEGSLMACEDCNHPFHLACLFEEVQSSDLLCQRCTENRQRLNTQTEAMDARENASTHSSSSSGSSSTPSSSSDDDFSPDARSSLGNNPTDTLPATQRLSPRGLPNKRVGRLQRPTTATPNYSQSTLSFTSKRKSPRINPSSDPNVPN